MSRCLIVETIVCACLIWTAAGCGKRVTAASGIGDGDKGPVTSPVIPDMDASNFQVDHPERFPLTTAGEYLAAPELNVTGVVTPDVSRQVPVPSLASGRVVEIDARVGDAVAKGRLLFKVRSSDIAGAFSDYRKAVKNEELTKTQLNRNQLLFENGSVSKAALEVAQNAEDNARVDLETTAERLRLLGSDPDHPTGIVEVYAPVSGVVTDQQIANASGVQALTPPNPFTISDVSRVWVVCDVYENDLPQVHLDDFADIRLAAYPGRVLRARISNIGEILDPNLRTAKVRLEVENPNLMRFGMFVNATFHGPVRERHARVPSSAILHLHDQDWVFVPIDSNHFRRVEVITGETEPGDLQEIVSGLQPGDRLVENALVLQNTVAQ